MPPARPSACLSAWYLYEHELLCGYEELCGRLAGRHHLHQLHATAKHLTVTPTITTTTTPDTDQKKKSHPGS